MKKASLIAGCFAIFLAAALVATLVLSTPQDRPLNPLDPDDWPTTVEEAVREFLSHASPAVTSYIRKTKEEDIILLYRDYGILIRNRYGLWKTNDKLMISACGRLCHPDDASLIIIKAIWSETRKPPSRVGAVSMGLDLANTGDSAYVIPTYRARSSPWLIQPLALSKEGYLPYGGSASTTGTFRYTGPKLRKLR
jgi:hypothetical protein